jgi:hypothetical protein
MLGTAELRRRPPRAHGDELFRGRGMNGDARIKVGLRGAHLDGHAEALHHFVCAHANYMQSDHLFFFAGTNELHEGLGLVVWILDIENATAK